MKQINSDQVAIGSGSEVSIRLEGNTVSAWHCSIVKKDGLYVISDLGSESGTILNGEPIIEKALSHGDKIAIGEYIVEFYIGAPFVSPSQAPSATDIEENQKKSEDTPSLIQKTFPKKPTEVVIKESPPAPPKPAPQPAAVKTKPILNKEEWKKLAARRPSKQTYAPPEKIQNLDKVVRVGQGSVVEVILAWGNRVIEVYHASPSETVTIGSSKSATINIPQLMDKSIYTLIKVKSITQIFLTPSMQGKIITSNQEVDFDTALQKDVISINKRGGRRLSLGQKEVVRIDLHPQLKLYIKFINPSVKASRNGLFLFSLTEKIGLLASLATAIALFYGIAVYLPQHSYKKEKKVPVRVATVTFTKTIKKVRYAPPKPKAQEKRVNKAARPKVVKKTKKKKPKKSTRKSIKKIAKNKKKPSSPRRTRKSTKPRPDPAAGSLLSAFAKQGTRAQLSKVHSNEISELADQTSSSLSNYSGGDAGIGLRSAGSSSDAEILTGDIATTGVRGGRGNVDLGERGSIQLEFGVDDIDVEGDINRDVIKRIIRRNRPQFSRCQSQALQRNPSTQGTIRLQWIIESGRVRNVKVLSNTTNNKALAFCTISRLQALKFPGAVPEGGIGQISMPFVFTAGDL